ncbi:MAG TPA: lamin tail domain-containing protein, partial [Elusimicrobiales bacterium]|nr:lamin tail domain-containing protein [Elusimicrobiales bacterium]
MRINEVSYGGLGGQFVELYNTSSVSTLTLSGYSFRNAAASTAGLRFRFTRKIYPRNYTLIDPSSRSDDGLSFTDVFGQQGFGSSGDFLALENSSGAVVDAVTWQSEGNYSRYDNLGGTVPVAHAAPAGASASIGRRPAEGDDSDLDDADFTSFVTVTPGARNNGAGTMAANSLLYPAEGQVLPRRFPLAMDLGEQASAAAANNIIFRRTGGAADDRSPHIYRLQDIGVSLGNLSPQTTVQSGHSLNDQDGYPLVSSAVYRLILNTDTGSQSAPQIILGTVAYDASVHSVSGSTAAPSRLNDATRDGAIRLDISNNSPAGFNDLELATVTFRIMTSSLTPMAQADARNLFNALMLVLDSTGGGTSGQYESGIDLSTIAYVPMSAITVDANGMSTFTVASPDLPSASVPAASTRTFFVVFESTRNASARAQNVFRVRFDPSATVLVRDGPSDQRQDPSLSPQVETSSITLIAPAAPPAGTAWP